MGLEPTTVGLRVQRSTDWASRARMRFILIRIWIKYPFYILTSLPNAKTYLRKGYCSTQMTSDALWSAIRCIVQSLGWNYFWTSFRNSSKCFSSLNILIVGVWGHVLPSASFQVEPRASGFVSRIQNVHKLSLSYEFRHLSQKFAETLRFISRHLVFSKWTVQNIFTWC